MDFTAIRDGLEEKKESFEENPWETVKQNWGVLAASSIFLLALYLRYMPAQGMQYLQALDPYWIFRQSQHLAFGGNIPAVDFLRYFPYNAPFHTFNNGNIIIPAIMYWMGPFLFFESYLGWAQFYPALMGALGVFMTYFLGKELYNKHTGVFAAFFLATIPGVLHRTSAGFFEKEPVGSFFMIVSLYFFTRAWRRKEMISGLLSGIALGLFTISWGGSKFLWLLYPLVVGIVMMLNEDIEELVIAYTPTILLGGGIAAALNPSRFWITGSIFLANLALLAFLWSRYLIEEFELIEENQLPYYVPSVSFLGLIVLALSPLYSNFIASRFIRIIGLITRDGGGVIAGTVAENTPASLGQLIGQLGATSAANIGGYLTGPLVVLRPFSGILGMIGNLVGAWPLAFIGVVLSGTYILAMVLRKFDILEEEVEGGVYYQMILVVMLVWSLVFAWFFEDNIMIAIGPSILTLIGGLGIVRGLEEMDTVSIEFRWYHILPFAWAAVSILGAITMSRLIFLSAFPTAFMAGYAFSKAWNKLGNMSSESVSMIGLSSLVLVINAGIVLLVGSLTSLSIFLAAAIILSLNGVIYYAIQELDPEIIDRVNDLDMKNTVIVAFLALTVLSGFSAGYVNADNLGGSPNQLWMENLDYMSEETPGDSVILSWWDYGYWFESIGNRAAVADGGNNNYYTSSEKINMPLADFLTSKNPENHTEFLKKHSVDYIVLDETMIGKYSAVSQISNRDNSQYSSMTQISTSNDIRDSIGYDSDNNTVIQFSRGRLGLYLPVNISDSGVDILEDKAPTIEAGTRGKVDCVLTPEGRLDDYDVEAAQLPGNFFGSGTEPEEICVAINPYYSMERSFGYSQAGRSRPARAVLVPKSISRSTLVKLYLMDGHGMEMFEKVEEGSPYGYVKMWEVNTQ